MPLIDLTDEEIFYIKMLISADMNDGLDHPDEEKLYEKLDKI